MPSLSVRPSRYRFLNQWAEFSLTCYMTFPGGNGEGEQNLSLYPMWLSGGVKRSVCPSVRPSHYLLLNQLVFAQCDLWVVSKGDWKRRMGVGWGLRWSTIVCEIYHYYYNYYSVYEMPQWQNSLPEVTEEHITKTLLYNFDRLNPTFI